jgi:hypothetical protein
MERYFLLTYFFIIYFTLKMKKKRSAGQTNFVLLHLDRGGHGVVKYWTSKILRFYLGFIIGGPSII